jgi:transcriptional regulator with XRE-family HTH domain
MSSPILQNYLLKNRKQLALSQEDVAYLLGRQGGAKISRYERFTREPSLQTALALEVIFQRSTSELFSGLYRKIEAEVMARAKVLADKKHGQKSNRLTDRRRKILNNIANNVLN